MTDDAHAGQRIYTPAVLSIYDAWVLGVSCRWIWRCPASVLRGQYDAHVRPVHLDVGVGTGYFLDRCRFPVADPEVTLLDLNTHSLARAAGRIARYEPRRVRADVLQPLDLPARRFGSMGLSFLLHCLPTGAEGGKWRALDHLRPALRDDGVLFGSTVLGAGVERTRAQRALMGVYNRLGVFSNREDSRARLAEELGRRFGRVEVRVVGAVALFTASEPVRGQPGE